MKIMALNCGSSSVKCKLYDVDKDFDIIFKATVERVGHSHSLLTLSIKGHEDITVEGFFPEHWTALKELFKALVESPACPIGTKNEITAVGHRIVNGGEKFSNPVVIDDEVMEAIRQAGRFAPLHSRPNILGIEESRQILSNVPQVAVFDTALHHSLPPKAFLYGLPIEYYENYGVRKYGFHGINHGYVAQEAAKLLQRPLEDLKVITCHLGSGCSLTAFENGKSIDTSMGLTPLEGVVMPTRCGDIDPSVVLHLLEARHLYPTEIDDLLNRNSGLKGLCGKSDMRDIIDLIGQGDSRAKTAIDVFVYRIQKYIGSYVAALNGIDAIVFTGGIGENNPFLRQRIMDNFCYLDARVDEDKNEKNDTMFSAKKSRISLLNICANEELIIAKQVQSLLEKTPTTVS